MPTFVTLVNDSFPQADGPLEQVNWTLTTIPSNNTIAQVVSHRVQPPNITTGSVELYTGAVSPGWAVGAQFIQVAPHQMAGDPNGNNFIDAFLFSDINVDKGIVLDIEPGGVVGQILITVSDANGTVLIPGITVSFVADAPCRLEVLNGTLTVFYNGVQIGQLTGQSQYLNASGLPGFFVQSIDSASNIQMSNFTAGNIVGPPPVVGGGERDFEYRFTF